MGFLTRFFSISGRSKRKNGKNDKAKKNAASMSNTHLLQVPQDEEAVVNRLLRSSSTHFSVLSETEYRALPPIPHPINNVLRAPSIISNATQADTYTVTVHGRVLHSRTEFPNANCSLKGSSSPSRSPTRRHSSPQLTPGDRNRLSRLRQDASVLSLLDIYDDTGRPDPQAFSNTPVRRGHHDASLRVLLGNPGPPSLTTSKTSAEESDISWADRYIRSARSDSPCSSQATSSLGIPDDLFKSSISPERLYFSQLDTTSSSRDIDVGIDSMQVERGTAEDSSIMVYPPMVGLISPTRRASQFFKFLSEGVDPQTSDLLSDTVSSVTQLPSLHDSHSIQTTTSTIVDDKTSLGTNKIPVLFVRDGPKESFAQVSPAPRRRTQAIHHSPAPPTRAQTQTQAQAQITARAIRPKPPPLGHRTPFDELRNADGSSPAGQTMPRNVSSRSVSVASSVHPNIELQGSGVDTDPYTPIAARRTMQGKRGNHGMVGENTPPCAPARPVRGQARKYTSRDCQCPRPSRRKETTHKLSPLKSALPNNQNTLIPTPRNNDPVYFQATPPTTPVRNPTVTQLQTPSHPSPASSSELSPEGRQIMASVRSKARKPSQNKSMTPRAWQSWGGAGD